MLRCVSSSILTAQSKKAGLFSFTSLRVNLTYLSVLLRWAENAFNSLVRILTQVSSTYLNQWLGTDKSDKAVLSGRWLSKRRRLRMISMALVGGMHVKREMTSYDTMVSSGWGLRLQTFLAKSCEFWMWCGVLPTKMEVKYLEILYVTELMLLTIGLSGVPCLWILGSP